MPDLNLLLEVGDKVRPPSLDSLRETARRRNRRAVAFTVTACALAVVAVIVGGAQLTGGGDQSAPKPASTPTPTTTPARAEAHKLPLPKRYGDSVVLDEGRYTVRLRNLPRALDRGGELLAFDVNVPEGWNVTKPVGQM